MVMDSQVVLCYSTEVEVIEIAKANNKMAFGDWTIVLTDTSVLAVLLIGRTGFLPELWY